jgi:hypothetical protein
LRGGRVDTTLAGVFAAVEARLTGLLTGFGANIDGHGREYAAAPAPLATLAFEVLVVSVAAAKAIVAPWLTGRVKSERDVNGHRYPH